MKWKWWLDFSSEERTNKFDSIENLSLEMSAGDLRRRWCCCVSFINDVSIETMIVFSFNFCLRYSISWNSIFCLLNSKLKSFRIRDDNPLWKQDYFSLFSTLTFSLTRECRDDNNAILEMCCKCHRFKLNVHGMCWQKYYLKCFQTLVSDT